MNYVRQQDSISCASVAIYNAHLYYENPIDSYTYQRIKNSNYNNYQPTLRPYFTHTLGTEFPYPLYSTSIYKTYNLLETLNWVSQNHSTVAIISYRQNYNFVDHVVLFTGIENGSYRFINHGAGELYVNESQLGYMIPSYPIDIFLITKNISGVKTEIINEEPLSFSVENVTVEEDQVGVNIIGVEDVTANTDVNTIVNTNIIVSEKKEEDDVIKVEIEPVSVNNDIKTDDDIIRELEDAISHM